MLGSALPTSRWTSNAMWECAVAPPIRSAWIAARMVQPVVCVSSMTRTRRRLTHCRAENLPGMNWCFSDREAC